MLECGTIFVVFVVAVRLVAADLVDDGMLNLESLTAAISLPPKTAN